MMPSKRAFRTLPLVFILTTLIGAAQTPELTEIRLRTDAEGDRVRPFESLTIQVLAYGEVTQDDGTQKVRLQRDGATMTLRSAEAGWLSKPFRYQGREREPFYRKEGAKWTDILLSRASGDLVLQDSRLFTAGDRPGRYRVEAELAGKKASITVTVDRNAPSRRSEERFDFESLNDRDPLRPLAENYAPFIAQETWFRPKSDYLARFDFDGDWKGIDNWDNAEKGSSLAFIYYAAMETETHYFLVYDFFHPRDYSDKCLAGTCHENDSEGIVLTILKGGRRFGRLLAMETLAHNNIYSYRADPSVRGGVHGLDGEVELYEGSHPAVFVESGGHGVYGTRDRRSSYGLSRDRFENGTGVTYVPSDRAQRPRHANDRLVGYQLLPAYEELWLRAHERPEGRDAFDDYFAYDPQGGRPRPPYRRIAGAFRGRKRASNKAKPFWGWSDRRTTKKNLLSVGQWALDPAYGVSRNLTMPRPFSLDYLSNPYLGIDSVGDPAFAEDEPRRPREDRQEIRGELPAVPAAAYDPYADDGEFDIRVAVSGELELRIAADRILYRALSGDPPEDRGSEYSQPLPERPLSHLELVVLQGSGQAVLRERPSKANGFTALITISHTEPKDDIYWLQLQW